MMNPYFCEKCCARYEDPGDCTTCPEEALLDLRSDEVIEMLMNFDFRRTRKRTGVITTVLAFILLPILFFAFYIDMKWPIFLYGIGIVAGTAFLTKKYPAETKCPPAEERDFSG